MDEEQVLEERSKRLPIFSRDLRRLENFVTEIEKNRRILEGEENKEEGNKWEEEKKRIKGELAYLLNLERVWGNEPEWYPCLKGRLRELEGLRDYLPQKSYQEKAIYKERKRGSQEEKKETKEKEGQEKRAGGRIEMPEEKGEPKEKREGKEKDEKEETKERCFSGEGENLEEKEDQKGMEGISEEKSRPKERWQSEEEKRRSRSKEDTKLFNSNDIEDFYEKKGIVGEKAIKSLLVYGALGRAHMGLESLSGAGKSALLYAFLEMLPQERVYMLKRATEKALFNDPKINDYEFLVVTELQKIPDGLKEDIKDLTEGVDSSYRRTNKNKDGVEKLVVSAGKTVIYTLAITNDYFKRKDNELNRRFIVFPTDISKQQNKAVAEAMARKEFLEEKVNGSGASFAKHIQNCLELDYQVKNPFLSYLVDNQPEEITGNVRYRSFAKHIQKLIKGCALFHHKGRSKDEQERIFFASLEDNRRIMEFYGQLFYDNIIGISVVDRLVLDSLELEKIYTEKEAIDKIAAEGFYDKTTIVEESLKNLEDLRFITKEKGGITKVKGRYKYKEADWEKALLSADELMKENYSKFREEWRERCCQDYSR